MQPGRRDQAGTLGPGGQKGKATQNACEGRQPALGPGAWPKRKPKDRAKKPEDTQPPGAVRPDALGAPATPAQGQEKQAPGWLKFLSRAAAWGCGGRSISSSAPGPKFAAGSARCCRRKRERTADAKKRRSPDRRSAASRRRRNRATALHAAVTSNSLWVGAMLPAESAVVCAKGGPGPWRPEPARFSVLFSGPRFAPLRISSSSTTGWVEGARSRK